MLHARGAGEHHMALSLQIRYYRILVSDRTFRTDINASRFSTWQAAIQGVWGKCYELLQLLISLSWFSEFI